MKSWLILLSIGVMILSSAEQRAHANVVYSYAGEKFDSILPVATSPYDTTMSVSGSFELAAPLAPDLVSQTITPVSYAFFDGINNLTNANSLISEFSISTNSQSNINFWDISLQTVLTLKNIGDMNFQIGTERIFGGGPIIITSDVGSIQTCTSAGGSGGCGGTSSKQGRISSEDGGQWVGPPVPIPTALPLFATALAGLALIARRRNKSV